MKIQKIIMQTDEGAYEYNPGSVGCTLCAFYPHECSRDKIPCISYGYWVKVEDEEK